MLKWVKPNFGLRFILNPNEYRFLEKEGPRETYQDLSSRPFSNLSLKEAKLFCPFVYYTALIDFANKLWLDGGAIKINCSCSVDRSVPLDEQRPKQQNYYALDTIDFKQLWHYRNLWNQKTKRKSSRYNVLHICF